MGIHPTAIVDDGARIDGAEVGPYCIVGGGVSLGEGVVLKSHVRVDGDTEIGPGTVVHPFAVLGGPPQHLGYKNEPTRLVIGAGNIIREHVTMNCGTVAGGGVTRIGDNGFFMTGAHIAHDCKVGSNVVFANNATLGGHVEVGDYVFLGGLSAVHQFCRIGEHAFVGGVCGVRMDVIPFAACIDSLAYLAGLNVVGLKRRGFSRDTIKRIRGAYKLLFFGDGVFRDRLERVRAEYKSCPEVARIVEFIDEGKVRPLMQPASSTE